MVALPEGDEMMTVGDYPGAWLVTHRRDLDRGEANWLVALADFDRHQGWYADGQLSGAEWLMSHTGMGRATAYEKLRIATQLHRRPAVADAMSDGRLSYSAARAITRIDAPDPAVDTALIDLAAAGTVADIERAVRHYQLHADQHRPPTDIDTRRGLRIIRNYDGTGRVEITLTDIETEELAGAVRAFIDHPGPDQPSPDRPGAVDESSAGDRPTLRAVDESSAEDRRPWPARQADALMDMTRTAIAHADDGHAVGADRYLVHLVTHADTPDDTRLVDGTPIDVATAERVACDTSTVTHLVGPQGEPLALGRKTREWSIAQRRAATIRDGGHCRFPGCQRRITDLHHHQPWVKGGPTDIDNGYLACPRHHTLIHSGYTATGDPNHTLTFHRPNGTPIGQTAPARWTPVLTRTA